MRGPCNKLFIDSVLMITGGTGSIGTTILESFWYTDVKEIHVFYLR